jgi:branched-chain amino acid transport system substrate-binding protein
MKLLSLFIVMLIWLLNVTPSVAAETVKIAAVFAKTGKAALGNTPFNGVRMAVNELNQRGGILGKSIELFELDNQSTALGSKLAAQKAVKANVIAVFGASWSSHSQAMAPICQTAEIPMLTPYSTNPQVTLVGNYIFRICYIDPFQGRVMANFSYQYLKAKTAGVLINADSKFSEGLAEHFIQNYKKLGGRILFEENYLDKTANFEILVKKINAFRPEVVFLPGYDKDSAYIIKQTRNSGLSTTFIGGDGWSDDMYKLVGDVIEGNYYSSHWHPDSTGIKSQQFIKKFKDYSDDFDTGSALSYDCVMLFADAVSRAGSLDKSKIRDAIAATENYQGVTGKISFNRNGDPIKSAVILKFQKETSIFVKTVDP